MIEFLKNNRAILLLNVLWIGLFFIIFSQISLPISGAILFSTPDSREYLRTGYEFFDLNKTGFSETRPFLYPILIRFIYGSAGAFAFWFIQFAMWLVSVNLLFRSTLILTKNALFSIFVSLLFCLNISLILLTLHGLTEVFSVFLISLLTYQIVCNFNNLFSLKHLLVSLLLLVLLAVVKPLFYPLVLIALGVIVISKAKTLIANPKQLGILILTLTPLLLQLGMMKYKYDKFTVSTIGDLTWRKYITAQVISEVNHFKEDQIMTAVKMGEEMPKDKLDALYQKHSSIYFKNWINNIHSNLANESSLLKFPAGYDHQKLYDFMISTNLAYRKMHILFFILYLISAVIWIIRKNYNILIGTSALMLLCFYIFGTSGIAFWQGDRIVLTALPLFFVSYAFLLATIVDLIQTKISQRKAERKI